MNISTRSRISSSFLRLAVPLSLALSLPCLHAQESQSGSSAASVLNGQGDANKTFGAQTSLPSANEDAPSSRGGGFGGHRGGGPGGETAHESISGHEPGGDAENGLADGSGSGFGGGQHGRGDTNSGYSAWTRLLVDAFQMGMRSRGLSGGGSGFGSMNVGSFLQMGSRFSQNLEGGQGGGISKGVGTALGVLPKIDQLTNQGLLVPMGTSNGKFQFSYKDQIGAGANGMGGEIGRGSAQASYSSGLKNDLLHFSAAATFGGMGGGFGSGSGGGQGATSFGGSGGSGAGIGSGSGGASGMFSGGMAGGSESHGSGMSMGGGEGHGGGMGGGQGGPGGAGHGHSGGGTGPAVSLKLSF
jgi:hypothetical protein